jgi:uncharacterized membrane protein
MSKERMLAYTDAVIAIVITIMVLELRPPEGGDFSALRSVRPVFITYVLSFLILTIYWNNHHHLMQAAERVNGAILWANIHLLFWLTLVPFVTAWMGENPSAGAPVALYGVVLICAAVAYAILARALVRLHGPQSGLAAALGSDFKGKASILIYGLAIPLAFAWPARAVGLYALVALIWLVPDRRFERG